MNDLVLNDLTGALRALRTLAVEFPDLPAVHVHLSPIYPDRLDLSLHGDLAGFETWRVALGISPDTVARHDQDDGTTVCLEGGTEFAGAAVRLMGFARLVQTPSATDHPRVAEPVKVGGSA
ncbi:hypothetical protein OG905_18940 [Streptomyces sp. NBC_00322]|uniref:hypothetical protein n=1 Tax=Streptomyces sp. NBC_00322 TaxID=2975712 RepID=UPI002E2D8B1C|nr:hypothetical protein [Streptomyces sp. NBC_00322]